MLRISGFSERFFLQWHLTDACNLSCSHCYLDGEKKQLSGSELKAILEKFRAFLSSSGRKGRIQLAGGEPLLSPHLFDIMAAARRMGLPCRILSNGTLITPELASRLKAAHCEVVQISLDGDRKTHEMMRGPGTHEAAVSAARALSVAGIPVTFMMTVSAVNSKALGAVHDAAIAAGARMAVSRFVAAGRGAALGSAAMNSRQVREIFDQLNSLRTERNTGGAEMPLRDPLWHPYFGDCNPHLVSGCSAGYNGICVDTDGAVYPCRRLPMPLGNILDRSFEELLQSELMQSLRDRDRLKGRCGRCDYRWQCGGCRAVACAASGDHLAEDPHCFREANA